MERKKNRLPAPLLALLVVALVGPLTPIKSEVLSERGYTVYEYNIITTHKDTTASEAIFIAPYAYFSLEYWCTQATDSVALDSIKLTLSNEGSSYVVATDVLNKTTWSKVVGSFTTANTHFIKSVAVPPATWMKITAYTASVNNGPSDTLHIRLYLGP